jgi:DNA gyrase/topoisomerase IV subunit A
MGSQVVNRTSFSLEDKMMLNDLSYRRLYNRQATITKRDLEKYLDSYNELENKYKDLIRLIEDDPGLKKMLEEELTEKNSKKFNL